jgi:hypothetical protein
MRPISMAQNDLLHGQPQYEHDNRLHALALATTILAVNRCTPYSVWSNVQ